MKQIWALVSLSLVACSGAAVSSSRAPASEWPRVREIAHESRRAEVAFNAWRLSGAEGRAALDVSIKCAVAMMATRDVGLTPSQRIYKYQYLGKSHLYAASFTPHEQKRIDHLTLADEALRRVAEAERDVRMDATWDDSDRNQFVEAKGYTALLRAVVRALQFQLGRATPAQVDAALDAIPVE